MFRAMSPDSNLEIYCPACRWEPDGQPHWQCTCGCSWNTFETAAVCPACGYRWRNTQCPTCEVLSPHVDWYHGLDAVVADLAREVLSAPASVCCGPNES